MKKSDYALDALEQWDKARIQEKQLELTKKSQKLARNKQKFELELAREEQKIKNKEQGTHSSLEYQQKQNQIKDQKAEGLAKNINVFKDLLKNTFTTRESVLTARELLESKEIQEFGIPKKIIESLLKQHKKSFGDGGANVHFSTDSDAFSDGANIGFSGDNNDDDDTHSWS